MALGFSAPPQPPASISKVVLDNGLTVLIYENHALPLVCLIAHVKAGSQYEPDEKAGLSYLVSAMLTKGTQAKSAEEVVSQIEFAGGYIISSGSQTGSFVQCEASKNDLDLALEMISDVLINPSFDYQEMERQKEYFLSGIKSRGDDPETVGKLEFNKYVYGKHPYHRPLSGYEETIENITREDLIQFHQKYYVPNNTVLAIAGDIDSQKIIPKIKKEFGGWPRKSVKLPELPEISSQKEIIAKTVNMQGEQTHVFLGHLGIKYKNPDYYTLEVLDIILGAGGLSSRIAYNLRDVKGLAYTAYSDITGSAGMEPGRFLAYMAVSPENKEAAITGLLNELQKIRNEPVLTEELEDAKSYLIGSSYFGLQGNEALANYLILCEVFDLGFDFIDKYPEYINHVTKEDIQRAARKYLHPEAYTLVIVGQ